MEKPASDYITGLISKPYGYFFLFLFLNARPLVNPNI